METNLILSSSPHIHTRDSSRRIMLDVIIALLPAAIAGVIIFGAKTQYLKLHGIKTIFAYEIP